MEPRMRQRLAGGGFLFVALVIASFGIGESARLPRQRGKSWSISTTGTRARPRSPPT